MKRYSLVTGASGGIGLEMAHLLAKDRHDLVLVARNKAKLNEVKVDIEKKHGVAVKVIVADLSLPDGATMLYNEIQSEQLHIDVLINNAGYGDFGPFASCDWQKQESMINLNILALSKLTRLFLPAMIREGYGRILNVASIASFLPGPLMAIYYATKAYVLSFTYSLSGELKGTGITVTALCPGPTDTGFVSASSLEGSKLFKTFKPQSAAKVAAFGYKQMIKGKVLAVPGVLNKLMVTSVRFSPRKLLASIVKKIQEKKK